MKQSTHDSAQPAVWSAFDLSEGFFLAHAFASVERLGILDSLKQPMTAKQLAAKYQLDERVLDATLQLLAQRTSLLEYRSAKYHVTPDYDWGARFSFLQYVGSYGPNAQALPQILKKPSIGGKYVDREQHKRAFERTAPWNDNPLAKMIVERNLNHLLDIGCGTASLLLYLASTRRDFVGWGVDSSPWMCSEARKRVAKGRNGKRIKILLEDSRHLKGLRASGIAAQVEVLTATGVANEFFSEGIAHAVDWLTRIRAIFPGRILFIEDYYGQLGFKRKSLWRGVSLHDFVQVISGQGVPPPNLTAWKRVYKAAQCKLVEVVESDNSCNFVHVLRL